MNIRPIWWICSKTASKKFSDRPLVGMKNSQGEYEFKTYGQMAARVENLRGGLAQLGVGKGDAVGLIINNSQAWTVIVFATFGRGARLVPMYEKELVHVWRYIIEDSGVKVLFVVNKEVYEKVKGWVKEIKTLEKVFIINGDGDNSMAAVEAMGKKKPVPSVKPHYTEIASLIYTSGTTGDPKGVLLSHGNFTTNVQAARRMFPHVDENVVTLSILPWAHSFGQTAEVFLGIYLGGSTGILGSVETIVEDLGKVRPTLLIAVPRVFNRVYAGIHNMMRETGGLKEKLFNAAKKRGGEETQNRKSVPQTEDFGQAGVRENPGPLRWTPERGHHRERGHEPRDRAVLYGYRHSHLRLLWAHRNHPGHDHQLSSGPPAGQRGTGY